MFSKIEVWLYRIAAIAWMGILSGLSAQPGTKVHVDPPIDKVVHLCAFGVLGFLIALGTGPKRRWHAAWIAAAAVSAFGALDELHQSLSPGRTMGFDDWLCDTCGGIAAGIAWFLAWWQGVRAGRSSP